MAVVSQNIPLFLVQPPTTHDAGWDTGWGFGGIYVLDLEPTQFASSEVRWKQDDISITLSLDLYELTSKSKRNKS